MRKHHKLNILAASIVAGSGLLLSACNGGNSDSSNSTVSVQHGAGATIHANNTTKLFGANSCLSGSINYVDNSAWYISGAVNITNTCATEQTLAGQTISFTSQDLAGNGIEAGTLNNWQINHTGYKLAFTASNGNQYIGEITADNNNPIITPNQTIAFSGGINLKGSHFNNALAQSSFAINGEAPKPEPSPEPVTTGQLNVKIDTSAAGCSDTTPSKCNNLHITVTDVNGKEVKDFPVPEKFYGGIYEQPIDGVAPGSYTVSGSIVNSTIVSYTPTNPSVTKGETTAVTVKYNKVTAPTGKGDISLPNKVAAYTGDLQIQILNAKANNEVVNTYTIRQGETINTGDLPVSDTTHAYKVKMTTGIADPLKGEYFIESGLPALSIKKGQTTALEIPMKASTVTTQRQVTLAISGLTAGDAANVKFLDAAGKYSYVTDIDKSNGSIKYKIENNLNLGVVVSADGNNYESNPITSTGVIKANTTIAAKFAVKDTPPPPPPVNADKIVTVYLLIDSSAQLKEYTDDLNRVSKVNFNRVIFSFVKPTLTHYVSGSLANTGIMNYFGAGDGQGVAAFNQLKEAVALSKAKHIQAFLSVGGWNYSCNYDVYGSGCGDAPTQTNGIHYDWFPDPSDATEAATAKTSYENVIKLTNDLGMQGIDLDAEEFWHADKYAVKWDGNPWSTSIANEINGNGGASYANLVKFGAGVSTSAGPAIMPKTVDKMAAIMHELEDNPHAKDLMFSTAAPPVGARPITGFVYGDNADDIYTKGGVWWLGNLKGLWYNLADKDKAIVDRFDSIGLMTYDLCGDNATTCAPYGGGPLDLPGQVGAYMKDYTNWLKATTPSAAKLTVDNVGKVDFAPAKYNIKSKIQFGFEVNQPAYPRNTAGQLQLTDHLVDSINAQQKDSGGVIIWQMYSKQNTAANGTTSKYTMNQSCKTFLVNDSRYDCNADFPSAPK